LAGAVLAGGIQEAEAQIVYVDLPDPQICSNAETTNHDGSNIRFWSNNFLFLDMNGQNYSIFAPGTPYPDFFWNDSVHPNRNPNADVMLIAPVVAQNFPDCGDQAIAWGYAYNGSWSNVSQFMGTSVNGYIKNLELGEIIGPGVQRATVGRGYIPVVGYYETCDPDPVKNTIINGDPNWVDELPINQKRGYIGIAFDIGGNTHYGWIQVEVEQEIQLTPGLDGSPISASSCITVLDYAYNSVPNQPIRAGSRGDAIPTLSQWGLICLNLLLLVFGLVVIKQYGNWILKKKTRPTIEIE
ncbi:MAG TPA: IPTL-CTERM sorting domain-containing protein, partial [Saprospiraceae bacterium]|nr:IPTL-CTERM sorting domain-containing protein [Saprospiraceae bacterium]